MYSLDLTWHCNMHGHMSSHLLPQAPTTRTQLPPAAQQLQFEVPQVSQVGHANQLNEFDHAPSGPVTAIKLITGNVLELLRQAFWRGQPQATNPNHSLKPVLTVSYCKLIKSN